MLRARLLTTFVFNLALAVWVWHDARRRRAAKPGFAGVLALLWGPLGLGLWESDRPLGPREARFGTAHTIARGFLRGWLALLPAMAVLAWQTMAHRAVVPGSLGRTIGLVPATVVALAIVWAGPAIVAVVLGAVSRTRTAEQGHQSVTGSLPAWAAASIAGATALAAALAV
jgi:hypothetical protein